MEQRPVAQGAGTNNVVNVCSYRVELQSGWQSQITTSVGLKQIATISIRGWVNCTLTIEVNDGRRLNIERMALPDARQVKIEIERLKTKAGLYE